WEQASYNFPKDVDFGWVRWEWKAASRSLTRAASPPAYGYVWYPNLRMFTINDIGMMFRPVIGARPSAVRTYSEFLNGIMSFYDPLSATPAVARQVKIYDMLFLTGVDADGTTRNYLGMTAERTTNPISNQVPNSMIAADQLNLSLSNTALTSIWDAVPIPDQTRVLVDNVEDCSISMLTRAGVTVADAGGGYNTSIDGEGYTTTDTASNLLRPRQLQIALTLVDRATGLRQAFTFTTKAP
ncbi:MAG: hypothetical protein AAB263_17290, partial [Planctomycetota bacterium]